MSANISELGCVCVCVHQSRITSQSHSVQTKVVVAERVFQINVDMKCECGNDDDKKTMNKKERWIGISNFKRQSHVNEWASNRKWLQSKPKRTPSYTIWIQFLVQTFFLHFARNRDRRAQVRTPYLTRSYLCICLCWCLWWHKSCHGWAKGNNIHIGMIL